MDNFVFGACQCKEEDLKQSSLNSITTSIVANKTKDTQKSLENTKEDNINGSGIKTQWLEWNIITYYLKELLLLQK